MIESFKKNKVGIILIIMASICACVGQLFWKVSASGNLYVLLLGFVLYALGALLMLVAYKFGSLSVLQPFLSLNYILSTILGYLVLNEAISFSTIMGILIIMNGVLLIGGGDAK